MKPYMLRSVLLASVWGGLAPAWAGSVPPDLGVVESALRRDTKGALEQYFSCERYQGSAYEKIATGHLAWVKMAEKVIAQTDACYTEGIQAALGTAMRKTPLNVLPLVGKTQVFSADRICLPFISAEQPVEAQLAELKMSKRAIEKVNNRRLSRQRNACLSVIENLTKELRSTSAGRAVEK